MYLFNSRPIYMHPQTEKKRQYNNIMKFETETRVSFIGDSASLYKAHDIFSDVLVVFIGNEVFIV